MTRTVQKKGLLVLLLLWACQFSSFSQSVTGIWRGYFIGNAGDHYRLEFQISQSPSGQVSIKGVSYSWQDDKRFYGKATMTGSYVASTQNFRIHEIQTVEVQNAMGGTCIMNYDLRYSRSGKEEFLEGTYLGKQEVKGRENPYEWGDCGGGRVSLRKVATTEFYLEPFLRNNKTVASPKPPVNKPPAKKTTVTPDNLNTPKKTTPAVTMTPKKTTPPVKTIPKKTTPPASTVVKTKTPAANAKRDTAAVVKTPQVERPTVTVVRPTTPPVSVPEILKTRQNELMKTLIVHDQNVEVKIFDNGEIDGDTISVYLDKRLVLSNKLLTASPLTLKIKMDEDNPEHELIMVAENLGRIPPNTSLMIVEAGDQRFEVRITSTEQKNAVVRFRYEKP